MGAGQKTTIKPRDAEATRQRIFEAASAEFAERGLAGARIDAIAERAGANKQLIYAYFGGKQELFGEVLRRQLDELVEEAEVDPDRFAEYAARVFDWHAEHPQLVRLLIHEGLHHGSGAVPSEEARVAHNRAKVSKVRAAQKRGTLDSTVDPRDLIMLVIALATSAYALPQVARMVEGGDPHSPRAHARRRAAVVEIVRRAAGA